MAPFSAQTLNLKKNRGSAIREKRKRKKKKRRGEKTVFLLIVAQRLAPRSGRRAEAPRSGRRGSVRSGANRLSIGSRTEQGAPRKITNPDFGVFLNFGPAGRPPRLDEPPATVLE